MYYTYCHVGFSVLQRLIRSRIFVKAVQIFCFLIDFIFGAELIALSTTEKYPTIFVDSSVFPFSNFYLVYFENLVLGTHKVNIVMSSC